MKHRCCPNTSIRKIARSLHEGARDIARQIATTPEYQRSRCERKKVVYRFVPSPDGKWLAIYEGDNGPRVFLRLVTLDQDPAGSTWLRSSPSKGYGAR